MMKALVYRGAENVIVAEVGRPLITDPRDAIIKVRMAGICGSDLHLYHNAIKGMEKNDILGHEFTGIVDEVGSEVTDIKKGERVVVSFLICDGRCWYCQHEMYSSCDTTNPSAEMEKSYGARTAGIFGYSHLTGGYSGGQAEYVRVPWADCNCMRIPDELSDEKAMLLADVLPTAYHATELANVGDRDHKNVAVFGAGPVGLLAAMWCKVRGATKIVVIDNQPFRLEMARTLGATDVIDFGKEDVEVRIKQIFTQEPGGPDACLDCVGFRYSKTMTHAIEKAVMLETDSPEVITEAFKACRKNGTVSLIGDYFQLANHFPVGMMMEKGLTVRGGQTPVQKYWGKILDMLVSGEIDPTPIITHHMALIDAPKAYQIFDQRKDEVIKVALTMEH